MTKYQGIVADFNGRVLFEGTPMPFEAPALLQAYQSKEYATAVLGSVTVKARIVGEDDNVLDGDD